MTPEEVAQIASQVVDSRLRELFAPPPSRFMNDDEVCALLRCGKSKLRQLIANKELIQGAHFTGDRTQRLWMRDRVERYIETRDSPTLRLKDLKEWSRK